ncbi:hypothetical protein [Achromobacter anxifer]|uniref:hypothetical protein n=1 Tax=Achromobacter anxifer TaxID=1287737 RepID=UPI0023F82FC0|nr:hypothetical protein [Achromobacter anxifer]MDF8359429.1 hypothetical protein [Achromobacter anxifer]
MTHSSASESPSPRFVLMQTVVGGVHVCASHPVLGPVYWTVHDNSDVGLPNEHSLTTSLEDALRLPTAWREHWLYGTKYAYFTADLWDEVENERFESYGPPPRDEDFECFDNGLHYFVARLSGSLRGLARQANQTADELLEWLASATWADVPAATSVRYLKDMNGFIGYEPVWTDEPSEALEFSGDDERERESDPLLPPGKLVPHPQSLAPA